MKSSGKFVVCDRGNERSRMQIFTKHGHFVRKIAIRYIDIVAGLAITRDGNIVAVDSVTPTIFVIMEHGELLRWFDCADYMREPSDIAVSNREFYVCDFKGHNVVVFTEEGQFVRRIGCENITNFPNGIDISKRSSVSSDEVFTKKIVPGTDEQWFVIESKLSGGVLKIDEKSKELKTSKFEGSNNQLWTWKGNS